jgi:hypothetical protein
MPRPCWKAAERPRFITNSPARNGRDPPPMLWGRQARVSENGQDLNSSNGARVLTETVVLETTYTQSAYGRVTAGFGYHNTVSP